MVVSEGIAFENYSWILLLGGQLLLGLEVRVVNRNCSSENAEVILERVVDKEHWPFIICNVDRCVVLKLGQCMTNLLRERVQVVCEEARSAIAITELEVNLAVGDVLVHTQVILLHSRGSHGRTHSRNVRQCVLNSTVDEGDSSGESLSVQNRAVIVEVRIEDFLVIKPVNSCIRPAIGKLFNAQSHSHVIESRAGDADLRHITELVRVACPVLSSLVDDSCGRSRLNLGHSLVDNHTLLEP